LHALDPEEDKFYRTGYAEVEEIMAKLKK